MIYHEQDKWRRQVMSDLNEAEQLNLQGALRHLETTSKIDCKLEGKQLKMVYNYRMNMGTTGYVKDTVRQIERDVSDFFKDLAKVMKIKSFDMHPLVFMKGMKDGSIVFSKDFWMEVGTKPDIKKLEQIKTEIEAKHSGFRGFR